MKKIRQLAAIAIGVAGLALGTGVTAQSFPSKPVKLVINLASGGPADLMARAFAENLTGKIGQPVIVEAVPKPLRARRPMGTPCCSRSKT